MKIIRISLTINLPKWVYYIAIEKDGSLWGFKCNPYINRLLTECEYGWSPSNVISLCECFASGTTEPCKNWYK
jgi:hypothetical protein